jgi:mycofactocin precursor
MIVMDAHVDVDGDEAASAADASAAEDGELLVEELLVEEISIDGMCGVY